MFYFLYLCIVCYTFVTVCIHILYFDLWEQEERQKKKKRIKVAFAVYIYGVSTLVHLN